MCLQVPVRVGAGGAEAGGHGAPPATLAIPNQISFNTSESGNLLYTENGNYCFE